MICGAGIERIAASIKLAIFPPKEGLRGDHCCLVHLEGNKSTLPIKHNRQWVCTV